MATLMATSLHRTETPLTALAASLPRGPDLMLSLSTSTCYHLPVSQWVMETLAEHTHLSTVRRMRIHTALHEAIANAVIHGNLGVSGAFYGVAGFDTYHRCIASRLGMGHYASLPVQITASFRPLSITVKVRDEGAGYDNANTHHMAGAFPPGLGLGIIRASADDVCITDDGRTIAMDFAAR